MYLLYASRDESRLSSLTINRLIGRSREIFGQVADFSCSFETKITGSELLFPWKISWQKNKSRKSKGLLLVIVSTGQEVLEITERTASVTI